MNDREHVNILMVDDQPGKLLSYEAILGELGENLIKAHSAKGSAGHSFEERNSGGVDGCEHAGARRVRAGGYDPAAPAISGDGDYFYFGRAPFGRRPDERVSTRRRGLYFGSRRAGIIACQSERVRGFASQDAANGNVESRIAHTFSPVDGHTGRRAPQNFA